MNKKRESLFVRGLQSNTPNTQITSLVSGVFYKKLMNMKQVILIGLLTLPLALKAQKTLTEYRASNGVTYHIGDTVKLGRGSGASHEFLYVLTSSGASAQRAYSGGKLVINKIHRVNFRGIDKVYFVTSPKYLLYIEDAIETCEVPCTK